MNSEWTAGILVIGSELLRGQRVDTNSTMVGRALEEIGLPVRLRLTVPDHRVTIRQGLAYLADRVKFLFILGGLGPTQDDLTLDAVSDWTGLPLLDNEKIKKEIDEFYRNRGIEPQPFVYRMARVLKKATLYPNKVGVAPGQHLKIGEHELFLLPGPPQECRYILETYILPYLRETYTFTARTHVLIRTAGERESVLMGKVKPILQEFSDVSFSILPAPGHVDLLFSLPGRQQERKEILKNKLYNAIGYCIYATDDRSLPEVLGELLRERNQTLSTAESCTAGLVGKLITDVPGSSEYYTCGYIVYSNEAKVELLGVREETLQAHGAVSIETAREMVRGCRTKAHTDWAVALTGIAGPTGGTPEKPVGTVVIAVEGPSCEYVHTFHFSGNRATIREESAYTALELVRRALLNLPFP